MTSKFAIPQIITDFLDILKQQNFKGDIEWRFSERLMLATDNSIYEMLPDACLYPKENADVAMVMRLLAEEKFQDIKLSARGGGTGTNGQSLNTGIILDTSRYLTKIIAIDQSKKQVTVQAGVIKDQLNQALSEYGLFFAPELSTSNRATIGGMINTDASGQGSCTYGKTRDHVLALKTAILGGEILESHNILADQFPKFQEELALRSPKQAAIYQNIWQQVREKRAEILDHFPKLNRCLTGYDLAHIIDDEQNINLNNLICGSEGSLGIVLEATLNALPIPKCTALVNIAYDNFMEALQDAHPLMNSIHKPTSIEIVDQTVVNLAKNDFIWNSVQEYFQDEHVAALNLVEFNAEDEASLALKTQGFVNYLQEQKNANVSFKINRISISIANGKAAVSKIYAMRKRAVGLLGNAQGERRPLPFVEDTAVPPEALPEFIKGFRAILDQHGLRYGMFGHADAGVLHVRPALDMKQAQDKALIRTISDQVANLCLSHGGVLWGEHGKGMRAEYAPNYFGDLYPLIQNIKALFDHNNQLNPGKIATPTSEDAKYSLYKIDELPFRGDLDHAIPKANWQNFEEAVHCNGNGACFNFDKNDAMCPSYKATQNRLYSPKGRAMLLKEWLRQNTQLKVDTLLTQTSSSLIGALAKNASLQIQSIYQQSLAYIRQIIYRIKFIFANGQNSQPLSLSPANNMVMQDFEQDIYESMTKCLACKSCTGQCPIKIDVPSFKSKFLQIFHQSKPRPWRDFMLSASEGSAPLLEKLYVIYRYILQSAPSKFLLAKLFGISNLPQLSDPAIIKKLQVYLLKDLADFKQENQDKTKNIVIVPDAFTRYFDAQVLLDSIYILEKLGANVKVAPFKESGKAWHVFGFLGIFKSRAKQQIVLMQTLAKYPVTLIGLEPAITLMYRHEYAAFTKDLPTVYLLQEHLLALLQANSEFKKQEAVEKLQEFYLLSHCTEKTNFAKAPILWQQIFELLGVKLKLVSTGCCGMSGSFGHLTEQQVLSKQIYADSWQVVVENHPHPEKLMATGYSCRSQVKRFSQIKIPHPASVLLKII